MLSWAEHENFFITSGPDQPAYSSSIISIFTWGIVIAKDATFLHADNEDSDQTVRMRRLIWVSVGSKCQTVGFLTLWLI